jgi:hypothetical protein
LYVIIFVISLFIDQPSNRTIIEITDDQIIRSGKFLLTVRMKFKDIREIKSRPCGLIIIKQGIRPTLNYYFSREALFSEFGIIFIPSNIDNYVQIKEFIEQKHYG